ncbi:MAG: hypothetical protein M1830_002813 [Pleopsidium flavum]|nr:MAG: hypothetical protein M1830_002813 [Pleopsidium flavum]
MRFSTLISTSPAGMPKRGRSDVSHEDQPPKRIRYRHSDRISALSDELVLRVLSHLPVSTLTLCQRLSRRFNAVAGDSQLWKSAYYNRFVRPRALRIPGVRDDNGSVRNLTYSSRISKWLDESYLVSRGQDLNWKRQYKLRHNWSRGSCDVSEIQVAERPPIPPLLVRFHEGIVFTVDSTVGLRAWSMKGEERLLASIHLGSKEGAQGDGSATTSLAVEVQGHDGENIRVAVGFADGHFSIYELQKQAHSFAHRYTHSPFSNGMISAIAYTFPYLLTMTEAQLLSLYCFESETDQRPSENMLNPPRLLSSLQSHTVWPPLSLSLRASPESITASIAYALPMYLSGWSVGLQELRITVEGDVIESRLASAVNQGFHPLYTISSPSTSPSSRTNALRSRRTEVDPLPSSTKPTSLSYSHPYLLASHPDNTLSLYLVTSTVETLSIGGGSRLWGHTSSVSGAHVGDRGKAVSVSSRGDELRVWELEGGPSRRRLTAGESSVQVRPEKRDRALEQDIPNVSRAGVEYGTGRGTALEQDVAELAVTRGWVGFDEEKVVVLQEQGQGTQALVIYDFT